MRILPVEKREAIYAVYAFCREVDDVADSDDATMQKRAQLADWRTEIERLFAGNPEQPTTRAILPGLATYGLEKAAFLKVIEGMEMDAMGPIRAPSMAELEAYCDCVASAVGLLCIRIFGDGSAASHDVAQSLGRALQLTNILRDLRDDADMGRLYMPRELLQLHGITSQDPEEVLAHPALPGVCQALSLHAETAYRQAEAALERCDAKAMRPAIIMMHVYRRVLQRYQQRGWVDVATYRPGKLEKFFARIEKLAIAVRYGFF